MFSDNFKKTVKISVMPMALLEPSNENYIFLEILSFKGIPESCLISLMEEEIKNLFQYTILSVFSLFLPEILTWFFLLVNSWCWFGSHWYTFLKTWLFASEIRFILWMSYLSFWSLRNWKCGLPLHEFMQLFSCNFNLGILGNKCVMFWHL